MASPSPGKKAKKSQDTNKYIPWLLAAIAKVKGQKQRPDESRICHVMAVAYGVPEDEALAQLSIAVKSGAILRLESKGKSSYKDPAVHAGVKGKVLYCGYQHSRITRLEINSVEVNLYCVRYRTGNALIS